MRIAFYEDVPADQFGPLALTRPLCELRCGCFSQRERILRAYPDCEWGCLTRDEIAGLFSHEFPEAKVNDYQWLSAAPTLLVNSRWLPKAGFEVFREIDEDEIGICDEVPVYVTLHPEEAMLLSEGLWAEGLSQIAKSRTFVSVEGTVIHHSWDLIEQNADQIIEDCESLKELFSDVKPATPSHGPYEVVGSYSDLWIDQSARVDPYVLFDVTQGPVWVDSDARISAFSKISGPCYIGPGSQLIRAFVKSGVSAGPECRLGGEIETSICHSHVNKYHTGFLGHSYLCPWVNLGAMTTNSDLKNDYSAVSLLIDGEPVSTGLQKVGCFIGDHAKTALGSLFNTGTTVGPFAMVLPDGKLLPKEIPAFSRYWHGEIKDAWPLDRYLTTAETVMNRRNVFLSEEHRQFYAKLYQKTEVSRNRLVASSQVRNYR